MLRSALGGVQYVGEALDKPGAALRGLLATGDPAQLLHAVPFSGALGLAPKKKISGRELLRKGGIVRRNRPGLDWGDVAGFGAEVALDPLWLVAGLPLVKGAAKGGATAAKAAQSLTKARAAFRAATKASKVPGAVLSRTPPRSMAAMAAQIKAGKRGLIGLRLPFAAEPFATFGEGSTIGAAALEKVFYGGGRANPLNWMRGLFSHSGGEVFHGGAQISKQIGFGERQMLTDAVTDFTPMLQRVGDGIAEKFGMIAKHHGGQGDRAGFDAFTRAAAETQAKLPRDLAKLLKKHADLPENVLLDDLVADTQKMADEFHEYLDSILEVKNLAHKRVVELGGNASLLDDIYIPPPGHVPRRPSVLPRTRKGVVRRAFEPWLRRRDVYKNLPGGTATVNRMARDPLLTATAQASKKQLRGALRDRLDDLGVDWTMQESLHGLQEKYAWEAHLKPALDDVWGEMPVNEAGQMMDDLGQAATYPRHFGEAFAGQPITKESEIARFLEQGFGAKVKGAAVGAQKVEPSQLSKIVNHFRRLAPEVRERGIFDRAPVEDALEYTKSVLEWESTLRSAHHFLGQKGVVGLASDGAPGKSLRQVWKNIRLGKRQRALTDQGLETFVKQNFPDLVGDGSPEALKAAIGELRIAPGAESILDTYIQSLRPQVTGQIGRFIDKVNALYKGWLFVPWPAAHSRNLVSGYYQSWSDGRVSHLELLAGYWKALMHIHKGTPLDSLKIIESEGMLKGMGYMTEVAGKEAAEIRQVPKGLFEWLKPFKPSRLKQKGWTTGDIFATRGFRETVPGVAPKLNPFMEAGEEAYALVEYLNRVGYAEALYKKGFSASEIKHLVSRSQFDYSQLSKFEQSVMRRGVLFYTWPRKNIPYTISKLIERPGGRTAQTFRAVKLARGEEETYTPSFLRERMAARFPFAPGTPQAANYMMASGLPIEEFNKLVIGKGGRTPEKLASYLHPLLTAGPEMLADKQFYSGRPISQLEPVTGISPVDRFLHYFPGSRVISEARGVLDPRKPRYMRALNALTGFKTATYDIEQWRMRDLETALRRELGELPEIGEGEYQYIRKDFKGKVPHLEKKLRQVRGMRKSIQDLRKKRLQQAGV